MPRGLAVEVVRHERVERRRERVRVMRQTS